MNQLIKGLSIALAILCMYGCKENNQPNSNNTEENQEKIEDATLTEEMLKYRGELIRKFNDTIPDKKTCDYYYLIFYSSFDNGTTIKFVRKGNTYFLYLKTFDTKDSLSQRTQYVTEIDKLEWDRLEYIVDEFDFWKAEQFKNNKVLDGYVYFLEGNRLSDNERFHQMIGRGSPEYDKMGALCHYIIDYEERLVFQYKQLNK